MDSRVISRLAQEVRNRADKGRIRKGHPSLLLATYIEELEHELHSSWCYRFKAFCRRMKYTLLK